MKLMISVRDEHEAAAALVGGADIIDVKNPAEGSLGAGRPETIMTVMRAVRDAVPVSASIGDVPNLPGTVALAGLGAATCGVRFVKVGLLGVRTEAEAANLLEAVRGALRVATGTAGLVACVYADAASVGSLDPFELPEAAAPFVEGCLIDTAIKDGRTLFQCLPEDAIARFIRQCHDRGLFCGLAGSLRQADLSAALALGADIVGVRTAACEGGQRSGSISTMLVERLKATLSLHIKSPHPPLLQRGGWGDFALRVTTHVPTVFPDSSHSLTRAGCVPLMIQQQSIPFNHPANSRSTPQ